MCMYIFVRIKIYIYIFFQIIEVFGFSIGYNGEFEILETKLVKISKFQKSQT